VTPPDDDRSARRIAWIIGVMALAAWFVMLWAMFGDVL
jgi:hypothetical protein